MPEAREFQLERLLSIMASIVAVTEAGTKAANSMGSTELFAQARAAASGTPGLSDTPSYMYKIVQYTPV